VTNTLLTTALIADDNRAQSRPGGNMNGEGTAPDPEFDAFYAATFRSVTTQLYAYFGNLTDAQDVAQEAYCRAFQRWSSVSRYDDPVAWVRRVAWRLAISRWRRVATAVKHARTQREVHEPAIDAVRIDLVRALRSLPADHRRAVVQHYMGGLSVAEIAAESDVADGTVKSWLHRGRTALAVQLREHDVTEAR
jgi:RNA polymerase sigma-70 factor (ECF subfamily)